MPVRYMAPPADRSPAVWRELLHRPSSIPGLSYELAPNKSGYATNAVIHTNSYGMRDTEPLPPGQKLRRIAVIGDSVTFGFGVPGDKTFPNVLEELLRESPLSRGRRVDVLNFGVGGYSTADEALVVKHKALKWHPRLIIIGYALNDPEVEPIQPLHAYFAALEKPPAVWRQFHLLRAVANAKRNVRNLVKGRGKGLDYVERLHAVDGYKWKTVKRAFGEIHALTRVAGIPVIVVIFPMIPAGEWTQYPYANIHAQIIDAVREVGFDYLDLLEIYSEYSPKALRVNPQDGFHPSMLGHKVAAEALLERLLVEYTDVLE